jgi:hypothetical protein
MASLQQQGVPIQSSLRGPRAKTPQARAQRATVRERTPIDGRMGGTRDTTTYYDYGSNGGGSSRKSRGPRMSSYNPAKAGGNVGGSVGGLEGEFLLAVVLLILLMFANSSASYGDRIMSLMKRGALTCLLFFVLSLIASTGPNATRIAKAFGALIIVAILLTSPTNTVLTDIDELIKNDWVGTGENAGSTTPSGDSGTQQSTSSEASTILKDLSKLATVADGQALLQKVAGPINSVLKKIGLP